jgi:Tol biopolymer transport system component
VLELVEGPTLQDRIESGPIPVEEARAIAIGIAEALEAAHERGIVHRDLKPANVKLSSEGRVKVLDFGLAKALDAPGGSTPDISHSPTLSMGTQAGVILGTAAYMAPEQARGKPADKRADIWAFGVVLWEMLTGRGLFEGETVSDVLAAVLKNEPDFSRLPSDLPVSFRRVLVLCLQKDPKQRLHDIADARLELAGRLPEAGAAVSAAEPRASKVAWTIAFAALVVAAVFGAMALRRGGPESRSLKLAALPPPNTVGSGSIDLSPDGRTLAFTASGPDGRRKLYVRTLDALEARELPATEDASNPFFSPDGRSLGFFAERKLKRIDLAGGPPQVLADAPDNRGGTWGTGAIVFAPEGGGPLYRVSASGGAPSPVTTLAASPKEVSHRWPHILPDGKHFVFMSRKAANPHRLMLEVGSLEGGKRVPLMDASGGGRFSGGRLWFLRGTTLFAQAFDPGSMKLSGEPAPAADSVWLDPDTDGYCAFALSGGGTLAYRGGGVPRFQMTWIDGQGKKLGALGPVAQINSVVLSPDGRQAAIYRNDENRDRSILETVDTSSGSVSPVGAEESVAGIYSPDGQTLLFANDVQGGFQLYRADARGTATPRPVLVSATWKFPESWSPDGRFVSFSQSRPGGPVSDVVSIWILPIAANGPPFRLDSSNSIERFSAFSPDGRFIAYASDETRTEEIYVRTFPPSDMRWRVTSGGGTQPRWSRDGKELFFVAPSATSGRETLMATPVKLSGSTFSSEAPRPLFDAALRTSMTTEGWQYDVSADGKRFLACLAVGEGDSSPIVVATPR